MNDIETKTVADASWHNRDRLIHGTACGCFHCQAIFAADEVRQWVDDGLTALCPRCGVDAVMPGMTDQAELHALHDHAFRQSPGASAAEWDAVSSAPPRARET